MPLKLEDFKQSNMLVTVLVIGLVLLLLFIPDLLGLKAPLINRAADLPQSWLSYRNGKSTVLSGTGSYDRDANSNDKQVTTRNGLIKRELRLAGGIRAENINADTSRAKFAQVRATSQQLAFALPREFSVSRFNLLNLIGGIDRVTGPESHTMSSAEAIRFLNGLDLAVSRGMEQEQVPLEYLSVWHSNSLGGQITTGGDQSSDEKPDKVGNEFGFVLKRILYFRYPGRNGQYDPNNPLYVDIEFATIGKDAPLIKKASLFKGKTIRRRTNLSPEMSEFTYTALPTDQQYFVEVKTRDGRELKRGFSFATSATDLEYRYDRSRKIYLVNVPLVKRASVASAADATTWFGLNSGNPGSSPIKSLFNNSRSSVSQF